MGGRVRGACRRWSGVLWMPRELALGWSTCGGLRSGRWVVVSWLPELAVGGLGRVGVGSGGELVCGGSARLVGGWGWARGVLWSPASRPLGGRLGWLLSYVVRWVDDSRTGYRWASWLPLIACCCLGSVGGSWVVSALRRTTRGLLVAGCGAAWWVRLGVVVVGWRHAGVLLSVTAVDRC